MNFKEKERGKISTIQVVSV